MFGCILCFVCVSWVAALGFEPGGVIFFVSRQNHYTCAARSVSEEKQYKHRHGRLYCNFASESDQINHGQCKFLIFPGYTFWETGPGVVFWRNGHFGSFSWTNHLVTKASVAKSSIFRVKCAVKKGSALSGRCSVTPVIIGQVTECSRYKSFCQTW